MKGLKSKRKTGKRPSGLANLAAVLLKIQGANTLKSFRSSEYSALSSIALAPEKLQVAKRCIRQKYYCHKANIKANLCSTIGFLPKSFLRKYLSLLFWPLRLLK